MITRILHYLSLIFIILLSTLDLEARDYPEIAPEDMPNVQKADRRQFVSDPDDLLSLGARAEINRTLEKLRNSTTTEVAVAIVPSLGYTSIEEYAEELFTKWGIGKQDKDNGVLLLISPGSRRARIQTGYGVEGVLPDMVCDRIIRKDIIPAMKDNDLDAATLRATQSIAKVLSDPAYAEELRSDQTQTADQINEARELRNAFIGLLIGIIVLSFLVALILFIRRYIQLRHSSTYHRAQEWRSQLALFGILTILSGLTALPIMALAWNAYRRNRNHSRKCSNCGAKMAKLDETTDNQYLDPSQDLEEQLGSVDYDVWKCPDCGELEIYPFKEPKSKFKKCPNCGTHAYHLAQTRILQPATTRMAGRGRRIYKCEYCGHEDHEDYTIPRKEDDSALLLGTAAALGAMSGRGGSGGGGGFGGGFGGGMTGGGGASGGW